MRSGRDGASYCEAWPYPTKVAKRPVLQSHGQVEWRSVHCTWRHARLPADAFSSHYPSGQTGTLAPTAPLISACGAPSGRGGRRDASCPGVSGFQHLCRRLWALGAHCSPSVSPPRAASRPPNSRRLTVASASTGRSTAGSAAIVKMLRTDTAGFLTCRSSELTLRDAPMHVVGLKFVPAAVRLARDGIARCAGRGVKALFSHGQQ